MTTENEMLKELLDRTRRMETRMVQLGDHVGANLRSKQKIEVIKTSGPAYVEVDSFDVSVSRILTELQQHDVKQAEVLVMCHGAAVCKIYPQ